ncbi:dihydrofolate reductase family protein, partial [bacterium]|nr:dihydrofolate reductase family protein [bacterium]
GPSPARIVLSPHQGIPKNSKIYSTSSQIKTILITSDRISDKINHKGDFELLELPEQENGRINPKDLLERLVEFNILSVLVEGGSRVLTSFLEEDVIDELYVGVASTIIGKGIAPFEDFIPQSWENRPRFMVEWIKRFGTDTVIKYIRGENKFSQD